MTHQISRRRLLAAMGASASLRAVPFAVPKAPATRRIVTLVYDKALGGMRAVEKVVLTLAR